MLGSHQLDKLSILTYVSQFYHKFSKKSPTPATRRSIKTEKGRSDLSGMVAEASVSRCVDKDKDNNDSNSDCSTTKSYLSECPPLHKCSPSESEEDFSSSSPSPYSSSSSSGCYQVTIPTDESEENTDDKRTSLQSNVSSQAVKNSADSSNTSSVFTSGNPDDRNQETSTMETSVKSLKSTKIPELLTSPLNTRKPHQDQTLTNFTDILLHGTSVFTKRQMLVNSPTPSSSSSKTSIATDLMCTINTASDSGLDQCSEMSASSSPSSSRLSSVSPSSEKMNRNLIFPVKLSKMSVQRKIQKKSRTTNFESFKENWNQNLNNSRKLNIELHTNNTHISDHITSVDAKDSHTNHDNPELNKNNQLTFKAALTKFNSLSTVSGRNLQQPPLGHPTVQLKSQSSQTDCWCDPPTQLVSQPTQTEESHMSFSRQCARAGRIRYGHTDQKATVSQSDPSRCKKWNATQDIRRNTLLRQMTGTNVFYDSVYNNQLYPYTHYKSDNSEHYHHRAGLQSTLV